MCFSDVLADGTRCHMISPCRRKTDPMTAGFKHSGRRSGRVALHLDIQFALHLDIHRAPV